MGETTYAIAGPEACVARTQSLQAENGFLITVRISLCQLTHTMEVTRWVFGKFDDLRHLCRWRFSHVTYIQVHNTASGFCRDMSSQRSSLSW